MAGGFTYSYQRVPGRKEGRKVEVHRWPWIETLSSKKVPNFMAYSTVGRKEGGFIWAAMGTAVVWWLTQNAGLRHSKEIL